MCRYDRGLIARLAVALLLLTPLLAAVGAILHYNGSACASTSTGADYSLMGVWGTSSSDVFAVGYGTVLHYNGQTWSPMSGATGNLMHVWGTSSSDVFAVGLEGTILHYDGSVWTLMSVPGNGVSNGDPWWVWLVIGLVLFGVGLAYYWRKKTAEPKVHPELPEGQLDEIKRMIHETEDVLSRAIGDATNARDLVWLNALKFLKEELSDLNRSIGLGNIGYEEGKKRILDLGKRVDNLRNRPSGARDGTKWDKKGDVPIEDLVYPNLGVPRGAGSYEILGISHSATKEEVDHAYKEKISDWFPDRFRTKRGIEIGNAVSKIINNARDQIYKERGWK